MDSLLMPQNNSRIGIHYFPDALHYREDDLHTWLPELLSLGVSWLTLIAMEDRAIPESFLRGLLDAGIEPILHFRNPLTPPSQIDNIRMLFDTYAKWGVRYVVLSDRPNTRATWSTTNWAQIDLVERFLDLFLPSAEAAVQADLIPVFPPLEPGGDYWDTAFLRAALRGLKRRGDHYLLDSFVLSAYAFVEDRSLAWGAGGPERWPSSRPYFTPPGQQDQLGFYIFDWYLALSRAVLGEARPLLLLGAGSRFNAGIDPDPHPTPEIAHAHRNLALARLLVNGTGSYLEPYLTGDNFPGPIPPEVLSCNFWLLAASSDSQYGAQAWFKPDGSVLPVVNMVREWLSSQDVLSRKNGGKNSANPDQFEKDGFTAPSQPRGDLQMGISTHAIVHYLLLPQYEWGVSEWHLDVIRPYIKKYRPTVGFSIKEAAQSARVTVIGGQQSFPEETIEELRAAGCVVERITGDGTSIATKLATL